MNANEWISLTDALPPLEENVIVTDKKLITVGSSYICGDKISFKCYEPFIYHPTHWMAFPKLQKK